MRHEITTAAGSKTFNKIERWRLSGNNCSVEVTHHTVDRPPSSDPLWGAVSDGPHRWCVYATISDEHAMFELLREQWQSEPYGFPSELRNWPNLHCGASYFELLTAARQRSNRRADPEVWGVKVGADYNHLGDERRTEWANKSEAHEAFDDAANLLDFLNSCATPEQFAEMMRKREEDD